MKTLSKSLAKSAFSLAMLLSPLAGCMPDCREFIQPKYVLQQRIENRKNLLVSIEGLQPYSGCRTTCLASVTAHPLDMALSSSSGDWGKHIPVIEQAYKSQNKIYLLGFSAGTEEVWNLANYCRKKQIPIELMVYLDPTHKNNPISGRLTKIPDNVRKVIVIRGEDSGWFGGRTLTSADLENPGKTKLENYIIYGTSHLALPRDSRVFQLIAREIGSYR